MSELKKLSAAFHKLCEHGWWCDECGWSGEPRSHRRYPECPRCGGDDMMHEGIIRKKDVNCDEYNAARNAYLAEKKKEEKAEKEEKWAAERVKSEADTAAREAIKAFIEQEDLVSCRRADVPPRSKEGGEEVAKATTFAGTWYPEQGVMWYYHPTQGDYRDVQVCDPYRRWCAADDEAVAAKVVELRVKPSSSLVQVLCGEDAVRVTAGWHMHDKRAVAVIMADEALHAALLAEARRNYLIDALTPWERDNQRLTETWGISFGGAKALGIETEARAAEKARKAELEAVRAAHKGRERAENSLKLAIRGLNELGIKKLSATIVEVELQGASRQVASVSEAIGELHAIYTDLRLLDKLKELESKRTDCVERHARFVERAEEFLLTTACCAVCSKRLKKGSLRSHEKRCREKKAEAEAARKAAEERRAEHKAELARREVAYAQRQAEAAERQTAKRKSESATRQAAEVEAKDGEQGAILALIKKMRAAPKNPASGKQVRYAGHLYREVFGVEMPSEAQEKLERASKKSASKLIDELKDCAPLPPGAQASPFGAVVPLGRVNVRELQRSLPPRRELRGKATDKQVAFALRLIRRLGSDIYDVLDSGYAPSEDELREMSKADISSLIDELKC